MTAEDGRAHGLGAGAPGERAVPDGASPSSGTERARTRLVRPPEGSRLSHAVGTHRRGAGDPTMRITGDGVWMARRTPAGAGTLHLVQRRTGEVEATAWGPGAQWLLDSVPALLGAEDSLDGFDPAAHPVVAEAHRRHAAFRIGRTGLVIEALVPAVIEQKVTGQEAFAGYRRLVRRFGEPAPGPTGQLGLMVAPTAAQWRAVPSWEWLHAHVDAARSDTIMRALASAGRLEEGAELPRDQARRRLRAVPGIGRWTEAEVAQRALGDADAVSFGDYHVAKDIGWALRGHEIDDDELAEVLRPWEGHRYRVQVLLALAGHRRPRRGARMAPRTHLPARPLWRTR